MGKQNKLYKVKNTKTNYLLIINIIEQMHSIYFLMNLLLPSKHWMYFEFSKIKRKFFFQTSNLFEANNILSKENLPLIEACGY